MSEVIKRDPGTIASRLRNVNRRTSASALDGIAAVLADANPGEISGVVCMVLLKEKNALPQVVTISNVAADLLEAQVLQWADRIRSRRAGQH